MHVSAPAISGSLQAPGSKSAGHLVLLCNIRKKVCVCVCVHVCVWTCEGLGEESWCAKEQHYVWNWIYAS